MLTASLLDVGARKVRVKDSSGRARSVDLTQVIAESALTKGAQASASVRDKTHLLDLIERAQARAEERDNAKREDKALSEREESALARYIERLKEDDFG